MANDHITNESIWTTDFGGDARREALNRVSIDVDRSAHKKNGVRLTEGVWMRDMSGSDRRSVKASLAGRGDSRVLWWKIASSFLLLSGRSLEAAMVDFHRAHHAFLFFRLETAGRICDIARQIRNRVYVS